MMEFNADHIN